MKPLREEAKSNLAMFGRFQFSTGMIGFLAKLRLANRTNFD
jgi:hypothetical protein